MRRARPAPPPAPPAAEAQRRGQHRVRAGVVNAAAGRGGRHRRRSDGWHGQPLRPGQPRRAAAVDGGQPHRAPARRRRRAAGATPPPPGGTCPPASDRRSTAGRSVRPARSGIGRAQLAAQAVQRLVQRVGVHGAAEAVAASPPGCSAARAFAAPDVDRQVVAHLVDEQVAAIRADLIGPVDVLRPAAQEDADRAGRAGSRPAPRGWWSCRPAAPRRRASRRARRAITAHRVAIRRASRLPEPMISTALIGWRQRPVVSPPALREAPIPVDQGPIHRARTVRAGGPARNRTALGWYHRRHARRDPTAAPLPMLRGERVWLRASTKADFIEDVDAAATPRPATSWASRDPISPRAASTSRRGALPAGPDRPGVHDLPARRQGRIGNCRCATSTR